MYRHNFNLLRKSFKNLVNFSRIPKFEILGCDTWGRVNPNPNPANPAWLGVTLSCHPDRPPMPVPVSCLTLSCPCLASAPQAVVALDSSHMQPKERIEEKHIKGKAYPQIRSKDQIPTKLVSFSNLMPLLDRDHPPHWLCTPSPIKGSSCRPHGNFPLPPP
jgi:hypothetical protein